MRKLSLRIVAVLLILGPLSSAPAYAAETRRLDAEEREELLEILRRTMDDATGWVRVHAAEALLWHGYQDEVAAAFREEVETAAPPYRIGVWRVMAQATRDPAQRRAFVNRIRRALADPDGPDRVHAAEALAKLDYRVPDEERSLFEQMAATDDDAAAAFPRWVLALSGRKADRDALLALLESDDPIARLRAAYAVRRLDPPLSAAEYRALEQAARDEPADSPARVFLIGAAWLAAPTAGDAADFKGLVREFAESGTPAQQYQAATLLGEKGTTDDRPLLRELVGDADPDVRVAAANAMLRIDRRIPHRMGPWDWAVIGGYMVGMLLIGWYYARRVTTAEDYMLGGRSMKSWTVGLSLFATLLSTISYLSWPGEIIRHGPMILCGLLAYPFIALVVGWFLIPFFMKLRVTSAYEILETRLGLSVRMLGSSLFLLLRLMWMAVIIYATADKVLIPLTGLPPSAAPWVCAVLGAITIVYTSMGGLRAVVLTDVLQTAILFGGALLALAVVTAEMGGVAAWWPTEWAPNWQAPKLGYDPTARVTLIGAFVANFTWFVCTAGSDQMAIQRYLATRDVRAARRMFGISLAAGALVQVFLAILGFALLAYFRSHRHILADGQSIATHADQLFPQFIVFGLPQGISGLVVAGLLAAAMSSLSSGLNSSCSVLTVDFIDRFRRNRDAPTDHVRLARLISVLIGVVVVLLSSGVGLVQGNLLEIAYKVVNLLVAPLFGLFFMAMFVPWATAFGTIVGAAGGLVVVTAVNYWEEITGTKGISFLWAMPLSFVVQTALGMVASLVPIGKRPRQSAAHRRERDRSTSETGPDSI